MQTDLLDLRTVRRGDWWARWGALTADAPPFLTPEFFMLARPLAGDGIALVACAAQGGDMTGALPLVLDHTMLRSLRCDHSPGYDFWGRVDGIAAIWQRLRADSRWSELVLDKLPHDSRMARELPALAHRDGCPSVVRSEGGHPFFELAGFEARLAPKFRTNILRCTRKAATLSLQRVRVPTHADIADALRIESLAWKGAAGTNIAADTRATHLYEVLGRVLGRRGRAALYFLSIGGERMATLFALEDRHTLYALKIGYDPQYASLSPGHLLVWKVAEEAAARGLTELDFVGRQDEWKRKWTDRTHEQIRLVVYQRSARGLARYGLREVVKPHLPAAIRDTPRSPLPRRCQRADLLGDHRVLAVAYDRVRSGLGLRRRLRELVRRSPAPPRLGDASVYPVGSWVRVRAPDTIRAVLGQTDKTRGLAFVPAQWHTCERVFRVAGHIRRIRDDHGRFRAVSRTVWLEGVDCNFGGEPGCGRLCPLMYRDEWLESATAPPARAVEPKRYARIKDAADIALGLDLFGRRHGLTFMPEMAAHAGKRVAIAGRLERAFELDGWHPPRAGVYMLEGLHCGGTVCGDRGPCDRACTLMWHEDWLVLEDR